MRSLIARLATLSTIQTHDSSLRVFAEVMNGLAHREDVLRRNVRLDVVHGGEDESAAWGEVINAAVDFVADLARGWRRMS